MTTSLMLISSSMSALPFGWRISAVMPSLLICSVLNQPLRFHGSVPRSPSGRLPEPTIIRCGSHARTDSTLMTSAPMSASSFVACGPAHIREKSRTRTPTSAPLAACESIMYSYTFHAEYPHVSLLDDILNTEQTPQTRMCKRSIALLTIPESVRQRHDCPLTDGGPQRMLRHIGRQEGLGGEAVPHCQRHSKAHIAM